MVRVYAEADTQVTTTNIDISMLIVIRILIPTFQTPLEPDFQSSLEPGNLTLIAQ